MCLISFLAVGFVGLLDWYGEAAVQRMKDRQGIVYIKILANLSQATMAEKNLTFLFLKYCSFRCNHGSSFLIACSSTFLY